MPAMSLALVEGIPGSGKSSTAQRLARRLGGGWWYEEEAGHPVYVFDDAASLRRTVDDLAAGRHGRVVEAALAKWSAFAGDARPPVVLDGCLFGYLTWSLFWADVPPDEIADYVRAVGRILRPVGPRLVYFHQSDVATTLRRICRARDCEDAYVRRATESPHGRRLGLAGFGGLVRFWSAYQALTDRLCAELPFQTVTLDSSPGWERPRADLARFFGLPEVEEPRPELRCWVGRYGGAEVRFEDGGLVAYGLPKLWPRVRLLPLGEARFEVESLPAELAFDRDGLSLTGRPLLLAGPLAERLDREVSAG